MQRNQRPSEKLYRELQIAIYFFIKLPFNETFELFLEFVRALYHVLERKALSVAMRKFEAFAFKQICGIVHVDQAAHSVTEENVQYFDLHGSLLILCN